MTQPPQPTEVTLGEVARGLSRVEREMREGFTAMRQEISSLSFVPAAVYAADMMAWRDRVIRLEDDLDSEKQVRREDQQESGRRAWQSRWSIILAMVGMPISIVGAVIAALVIAALR